MKRGELQLSAKNDIREIRDYIGKDSPANAGRFVRQLLQTVRDIARTPGRGRPINSKHLPQGSRRAHHGNYFIYYAKEKAEVQILRVINRYRNQSRALRPERSDTNREKSGLARQQKERELKERATRQKPRTQLKRKQDKDIDRGR